MRVEILSEYGYEEALLGLSLSFNSKPSARVASRLAHRQGGHNKFLESMVVYLDVTAPRYWWQQFDTYRVGTTKQSESTMHTLLKHELTRDDFEGGIQSDILKILNWHLKQQQFDQVKRHLPESFLQRRIVCTNYKVLQNMEFQRRYHKLPEWQLFLDVLQQFLDFPEFVKKEN